MLVKFLADGTLQLVPEGPSWFLRPRRHAIERFVERVRPDLNIQAARWELAALRPAVYRQTKKDRRNEPNVWHLLYEYGERPFTVIARLITQPDADPPRACRQVWRAITTLAGHDHY